MLSKLAASGEVVTERLAELILQHWDKSNQRDADAHVIAGTFVTSFSTVQRVIKHRTEKGVAWVPQQGQGKTDDERWIFSG